MRVLVTGASGLVGQAAVEYLEAQGYEVAALARHPPSSVSPTVEAVQLDMADPAFPEHAVRLMRPCEAIVHAAASLDLWMKTSEAVRVNTVGVHHALALARTWGSRAIVFLSSIPVIGRPVSLPVTEEHPLDPLTPYHAAKLLGERLIATAALPDGAIAPSSLRLTAPVGRGMPANRLLTLAVARALKGESIKLNGKGTRRQDYVDVRDIAAAIELCVRNTATGIFNVGSGTTTSNLELARLCIEVTGSRSQVVLSGTPDPEDGVTWDISVAKASRVLGYSPRYALRDSVEDIVSVYRTR